MSMDFLFVQPAAQKAVSWTWGDVNADGLVLLEGDSEPLPPSTDSLVELVPGARVLVMRQAGGLVVVGAKWYPNIVEEA